jgi:pimeloyl-ACP methyl ester carboxylesterase
VSAIATTSHERPVFFRAAGEDLFGIITEPTVKPKDVALVLLAGGAVPAPNRNRLSVKVARRVAALGYHALRLDYHGVGESSGEVGSYRLDRPFVDDVLAAVRCVNEYGVRDVVLVGTCFGARTALACADRIPALRGIGLLAPPTRDFEMGTPKIEATPASHYLRRAFSTRVLRGFFDARRRRWYFRVARTKMRAALRLSPALPGPGRGAARAASPHFSEPLAKLAARGTPVLLAYGTEDDVYGPFRDARRELAATLEAPGSRIQERTIPGRIHGLSRLAVQDAVATLIEEWLVGLDGVPARGT